MWIIRKGDKLFHKHYELNKDSIFFDVGGHLGGFTDKILAIYNCKSYIFEPHPEQYIQLAKKYSNNDRVQVFDYGLGGVNKEVYLTDEEGSSEVTQNETNFYHVDTVDTTLLLSNLVLGEDTGKSEAVKKLGERNFGNYPNYLLSGRPCATRGCPPEKFCDSSGWPESPVFKPS